MNGYFQVVCSNNQTYLHVFPPTDGGMTAATSEIGEYLGNKGIPYDSSAISEIAGMSGKHEVLINHMTCDEVREDYKLTISPDKMNAIVRFYPPSLKGGTLSKQEFIADLSFKGIEFGIQEEEIDRFFNNKRYCEDYIVAVGQQPRHGSDAYIEYYFNTDLSARPTLKEDGSVDFFHLNTISHCHEGDVLAKLFRKIPAMWVTILWARKSSPGK